jgi:poly(beta-D-mannuronate) lyase
MMMKKIAVLATSLLCIFFTANCKTISVKNITELLQANAEAKPGDVIILQNGKWSNSNIVLSCNGTKEQPIIFKAATKGKVIITGESYLHLSGNYIVVDGLYFTNGFTAKGHTWEFKEGKTVANNCRITNCFINGFNTKDKFDENYWVALYGKNNRIDHCSFTNKTNIGVLMAVVLDDERSRENNHNIDSNYFGVRKPLGSNGGEIIRVGVSQHCTFYSNTIIRNNLFEQCDGETEIISIKSCGNILRNNVFKECQGALVLRHGNNNTVEGNIFWGNNKEGSGGVRIINEGNWVVNNFFANCKGEGFRSPLTIMNGVPNSPPHRYLPVRDAVIANNSFVNCTPISFGEGTDAERSVAAANVYCFNNIFLSAAKQQLFNQYSSIDSISFSGNVISKTYTNTTNGFAEEMISQQKWDAIGFPVATTVNNINLPDSIKKQEGSRLQAPLSNKIGCSNLNQFKTLFANAGKMGISWKTQNSNITIKPKKVIACKDAAQLYNALAGRYPNLTIILTGNEYVIDKTIAVYDKLYVKGNSKSIILKTTAPLTTILSLKENSSLTLERLNIDASLLQANNFVLADSSTNNIHFNLTVNNCKFNNLTAASFYYGEKKSYATEIIVSNSSFNQCKSNLFVLKDEEEKKGYYNAENITINSCTFSDNNSFILDIARTGTDESTMGPKLLFAGNLVFNCNTTSPLIKLFGVQQSVITNNAFNNSNKNATLIQYIDNVRANHTLQKNLLNNSGKIIENKFVKQLK